MRTRQPETKKKKTFKIKKAAIELGMDFFGVAQIRNVRQNFFQLDSNAIKDFKYVISMGVRLSKAVLDDIQDRPTPLYLHHYRQSNYLLDRTAFLIAQLIEKDGFRALPIAASQVIDWENQRGHVPHKAVAVEAGHGWLGRNNLLVHPLFGSQVRLVSVLTDYPLLRDKPQKGSCGSCQACVAVCPVKAINDDYTQFNHMQCFEMLRFFKNKINIGHYICGICVKACKGNLSKKPQRPKYSNRK